MAVLALDHVVLTVRDLEATRRFYCDGLGLRWTEFGEGRFALAFGRQKINLHPAGREIEPKAARPTPGSADLCFLVDEPPAVIAGRMAALGHPPILGPVLRTGAVAPLESVYLRDPDGNLVELARELSPGPRSLAQAEPPDGRGSTR
jgi:catechol 2,3-dioxygenase-like lactoylglutathione lyase family enzyme